MVLAVVIAACAALAIVGLLAVTAPWRGAASPPNPADPVADRHPPEEPIIDVNTGAAGWHSFVFVSTDEQICGGSASTERADLAVSCWMPVTKASVGRWIALPAFQTLPAPWNRGNGNEVLVMGLFRCQATSVDITFRSQKVMAVIQPVAVHGRDGLSLYTAWLPLNGATTYGTADISSIIARDRGTAADCPMLTPTMK